MPWRINGTNRLVFLFSARPIDRVESARVLQNGNIQQNVDALAPVGEGKCVGKKLVNGRAEYRLHLCLMRERKPFIHIDQSLTSRNDCCTLKRLMPRLNCCLVLLAILAYALTSGITLRDRLLVSTLHRMERHALMEPSAKDLFEGAMSGMVNILAEEHGDQYSLYIPPSEQVTYQDHLDSRYAGMGISTSVFDAEEDKKVFVDFPFYDSPAYRAGLRSGDQILQVDGNSLAEKTNSDIFKLLRQQRTSEIHLFVLPFGQNEPQDFLVHRETIHQDSVEGDYYDSGSRVFRLEEHPTIGYIRMTSFNSTTAKEFESALDIMTQSGAESFILDLRDNGGGDVSNSILVAKMLLSPDSDRKTVVTTRSRSGYEQSYTLTQGMQRCTLPMVVLIDGETASSSEIVAAALQDHRRATIVGTRSFGKGVIQGIFDLPFHSGMLQLTHSEYRRPSGGAIHRKQNDTDADDWGVIPDTIVELSEEERTAVLAYRSLRSNVIAAERRAVLEQFRQQIIAKQETKQENELEFTCAAPYYDRQLDEAIRILFGTFPTRPSDE